MREANWDEIFQRRRPEAPEENARLSAFIPWEDWLTFAITAVVFMSVVASIDGAGWVDDMPSLYPIGFSALVLSYALSRLRWNELMIHPLALVAGALLVYLQLLAILPGGSIAARTDVLLDRMYEWWSAATQDGISNDTLPFITLILVLTWLGAYVSGWAVFRWRNPWLALVPGGIALMWNISFIPGQFSYSFVVFVFGAVLLLMRLHVAHKEAQWDREGIAYPEFISLSVLNATFWVTVVLLLLAWVVPLAERSDSANERWQDFTSPLTQHLTPLGRVFVGVNAKKPINVHNLEDALPLQGKIKLNSRQAVTIDIELTPEMAQFLREQSFDEYTSEGWKNNVEITSPLGPGESTGLPRAEDTGGARADITINVTVAGGNDQRLFSVGQPLQSDQSSETQAGAVPEDIASVEPAEDLDNGDRYSITGSVTVASVEQLRAAGTDYPDWVTERYLGLPTDLPARVGTKAEEVAGREATPYDQTAAIEEYVRSFPNDFNVPSVPAGRDSVDYFLFETQRGYFDYHASAMAVLLRTLGVPARVATGYVIDPLARDGSTDTFHLTQKNAFAWPEVYFPGIGWVEFSPTPSQPTINRPGVTAPEPEPAPREENIRPEEPNLGISPPSPGGVEVEDGGASRTGTWIVLLLMAIIGLGGVSAVAGTKFAWEFGLGGLPEPARIWEKTLRLASLGRVGPRVNETPREFAARLRRDVPGTDAVGYVQATYERTRFGQQDLSDEEAERLESAWSSLRGGLLRRVLRLKPRS